MQTHHLTLIQLSCRASFPSPGRRLLTQYFHVLGFAYAASESRLLAEDGKAA